MIDAEVAVLVDALAAAGTGWPEIAAVLGVSRQAHQRRRAGSFPSRWFFGCRLRTLTGAGCQTQDP